ncbi:MAG: ABC transporter ATP-binding protein [Candidatus Dadabacteria bacterium]|nr:MAG: ABC transporter ATP-binding protein [Candidatus Dadabacteria bacterium]
MALVELEGVEKIYRLGETRVHALRGVDLRVDPGEFVAVWGPSGSGKTSLLNLIGVIDEPTRGAVRIGGQDVAGLSENRKAELRNRHIGFIFQSFNLVPVLSALENVMLPLQIRGEPTRRVREKALHRLEQVGLSEFVHHRPDKMSGGQRQRVAIARALVTDPEIVIADEPTANLDSETSHTIIELMRRLNDEQGTTFIFSTHDPRLLDQVKRLVRLEDGRIVGEERRDEGE